MKATISAEAQRDMAQEFSNTGVLMVFFAMKYINVKQRQTSIFGTEAEMFSDIRPPAMINMENAHMTISMPFMRNVLFLRKHLIAKESDVAREKTMSHFVLTKGMAKIIIEMPASGKHIIIIMTIETHIAESIWEVVKKNESEPSNMPRITAKPGDIPFWVSYSEGGILRIRRISKSMVPRTALSFITSISGFFLKISKMEMTIKQSDVIRGFMSAIMPSHVICVTRKAKFSSISASADEKPNVMPKSANKSIKLSTKKL
jgi:hypothetical protein